jgi:GxxExxY protein
VIVEIKTLPVFGGHEVAQTLNYLRASSASRALLINFGSAGVEFKRLVGDSWKTPSTD